MPRRAAPLLAAVFACLSSFALSTVPPLQQSCGVSDDLVQCSALRTFAMATGYATWGFSGGWLTGSSYCSWTGVACDPTGSNVVSLCAPGPGPEAYSRPAVVPVWNFKQVKSRSRTARSLRCFGSGALILRRLSGPATASSLMPLVLPLPLRALSTNELWGTLPSELGNLTHLNLLSLPYNSLSGTIPPEIGGITSLTTIRLSTNLLLGSIPDSFSNLVNLQQLCVVRPSVRFFSRVTLPPCLRILHRTHTRALLPGRARIFT